MGMDEDSRSSQASAVIKFSTCQNTNKGALAGVNVSDYSTANVLNVCAEVFLIFEVVFVIMLIFLNEFRLIAGSCFEIF